MKRNKPGYATVQPREQTHQRVARPEILRSCLVNMDSVNIGAPLEFHLVNKCLIRGTPLYKRNFRGPVRGP